MLVYSLKALTYWEEPSVGNNLVDGGSQTKTEPKLYLFKTESSSALIS
jgi:hypothetical protein